MCVCVCVCVCVFVCYREIVRERCGSEREGGVCEREIESVGGVFVFCVCVSVRACVCAGDKYKFIFNKIILFHCVWTLMTISPCKQTPDQEPPLFSDPYYLNLPLHISVEINPWSRTTSLVRSLLLDF